MYVGKKVRLRAYRKEDINLRLSYINNPEIERLLVADIPYPISLHEEQKWFESISAFNDTYKFAIETLEDNQFIGGCSINAVDWKNSVVTVGIFIGNINFWGKGYGTDAMKILLSFIFLQMNINKVRLITYSFNERAVRCYKKCGFKTEGILRKEMYRDGKYHDKIAMGILKEEFLTVNNL
ncbi:GNAT family N-acetyltransferase [Clostridium sp. DJ247]|uniref:GNAT family N-acetyltransferase n=1 Tax=Clostridium sp. DJ247 TaxID=2726188 RepID=UPI001629A5C6|nr:GNAT family protein [Clostridium sp. DJ247]MBC2579771.1 GNAT family N-acetyltransferase [Clostridium sp. DJ247]